MEALAKANSTGPIYQSLMKGFKDHCFVHNKYFGGNGKYYHRLIEKIYD
jgi:hypothetical protein